MAPVLHRHFFRTSRAGWCAEVDNISYMTDSKLHMFRLCSSETSVVLILNSFKLKQPPMQLYLPRRGSAAP